MKTFSLNKYAISTRLDQRSNIYIYCTKTVQSLQNRKLLVINDKTTFSLYYSCFAGRIRKALENKSNMEDDRVAILESQLAQAKLIAEEADKKYEEVDSKVVPAGGGAADKIVPWWRDPLLRLLHVLYAL